MDVGIKNHVTTSIVHIHIHNCLVIKTIHRVVNIITTEAELFTIKCSINQAICIPNIKRIMVVTDSIYTIKRIFDSLIYLYQIHLAAILHKLRDFFEQSSNNTIEFWNYSNCCKWSFYAIINKAIIFSIAGKYNSKH